MAVAFFPTRPLASRRAIDQDRTMSTSRRQVRTAAAISGRRDRACANNRNNNARLQQAGD
jgi:hypothetical protein